MQLFDTRDEYAKEALLRSTLESTPFLQFKKWYQTACDQNCDKPNAMTFSTSNSSGFPRGRIVLLKEMTQDSFVFFTNYDSIKGSHLANNPQGCLSFYWSKLDRQVIIQGSLHKSTLQESQEYFHSRPLESQISAAVSAQSQIVDSRRTLLESAQILAESLPEGGFPKCPSNWGGYHLRPTLVEFWQGRPDRMHDRFQYQYNGSIWSLNRLAP